MKCLDSAVRMLIALFLVTIAAVAQAGTLDRQSINDATVDGCLPSAGRFECAFQYSRNDSFTNAALDSVVTVLGVELVLLDPEDVGYANMETTNVLAAVGAATASQGDVDDWGAYWINTRDPAHAVWSASDVLVTGPQGETAFPISLGPGQSLRLTSTTSISEMFDVEPEVYEGELVIGWDMDESVAPVVALQAGDADQDFDFDQLDLVKVQQGGKYFSAESATWGEGDWNGAPGGWQGSPPMGDGAFNQFDIIAALNSGTYLTGPYNSIQRGGGLGVVDLAQVAVPEPSALVLAALAALAVAAIARRS